MVYKFRSGETYRGIPAQDAGRELERIRESNDGKLHTEAVVKAARAKTSPLHGAFTWDDGEAANKHRLWEARYLLREITVIQEKDKAPVAAFVHVRVTPNETRESDAYYQSSSVIVNSPLEYDAALADCVTRLESAQRSLAELQGLATRGKKAKVRRAAANVRAAVQELNA